MFIAEVGTVSLWSQTVSAALCNERSYELV